MTSKQKGGFGPLLLGLEMIQTDLLGHTPEDVERAHDIGLQELVAKAARTIRDAHRVRAKDLTEAMGIPQPVAVQIMHELETLGYVSKPNGRGFRVVHISEDLEAPEEYH